MMETEKLDDRNTGEPVVNVLEPTNKYSWSLEVQLDCKGI
jgi:hypothetical protein